MDKKYYKVTVGKKKCLMDSYSICMVGIRKPSPAEAKEFLKSEMEKWNFDLVFDVEEISPYEAHAFYNMENEEEFPVFGV